MVQTFKPPKQNKSIGQVIDLTIERLDINGLGVAQYKGKPVFVAETLPDEQVSAKVIENKSKYSKAKLLSVLKPSANRVEPKCQHFKQCGGCDLQHLPSAQQRHFKQQKVSDLFSRQGIDNLPWQPAIFEESWHYRRKARIGVQYNKRGEAIIGFRKKMTNELTPVKSCPVLEAPLAHIFEQLTAVVKTLSLKKSIGHIEVFSTNGISIVIRQLTPLNSEDKTHWLDAAAQLNWQIFIDEGKEVSLLTDNTSAELRYLLADNISIEFRPTDFIQVNNRVNQLMVQQATEWLSLSSNDSVLDLFCGLGNFSLALAQHVNTVVAVEGVKAMTEQAQKNAEYNRIGNCHFYHANLNEDWQQQRWAQYSFDKVVLDPARAGAYEACQQLIEFKAKEVLYVSCDPTTLARDSKLLIDSGYRIKKIALIDMFSQTKHVETMVLFQQN